MIPPTAAAAADDDDVKHEEHEGTKDHEEDLGFWIFGVGVLMGDGLSGSLFGEGREGVADSAARALGSGAAKGKKRAGKKKAVPVKSKMRREFSAGFILYRETAGGPVFLLLDYGKHWDYAKGHLEEGETAWQAAVRELREETGIRQVDRVTKFQRDMHYVFYSPRKGRIHKTVTYFLGRTRTEDVKISEEHMGHVWLGYEDAMERLTYENARELMQAAHDALQNQSR